ncbi:MAG: SUF system NifU family Fe-S cluster assembly protein [Acidobacteriota bacterium]
MSELMDLYQEVILDHNKKPRNFGPLADPDKVSEGNNPLCGDELVIFIKMDGDRIERVKFEGSGCAISTASASLMTETIQGKTISEVNELFEGFHELLTGDPSVAGQAGAELGKLAVFSGVREFPVRVKCATLAWHTLQAALNNETSTVSTE